MLFNTRAFTLLFSITASFAAADQSFHVSEDQTLTAVVYIADEEAAEDLSEALGSLPLPEGAEAELLLQSRRSDTFVQIFRWEDHEAAIAYRGPYFPVVSAYWRREFTLTSSAAADGAGFEITAGSAVQWSEFLMRDPSVLSELHEMVSGMVGGMASGGVETLQSAQVLTSTNGLSIGILAQWTEPEGFEVFVQDETFGDDPYWHDYADNAHWMLRVVSIR